MLFPKNSNTPQRSSGGTDPQESVAQDLARSFHPPCTVIKSIVRLEQEEAIRTDLSSGTPVLIRGHWRIGKTVMARCATELVGIDPRFGDFSTMDVSLDEFRTKHFSDYVARAACALGLETSPAAALQYIKRSKSEPLAYLDAHSKLTGNPNLVFDEVIGLNSECLRYLLDQARSCKQLRIAIVLHHIADRERDTASMTSGFSIHYIAPLTSAETSAIVRTPLAGSGIKISSEAVELLHRFSGGRPIETQLAMCAMLSPGVEKRALPSRITVGMVEAVTKNWESGGFHGPLETYSRILSRAVSPEQRSLILQLSTQKLPRAQVESINIAPLLKMGIIVESGKSYRLNGDLFANYAKRVAGEQ